MCAPNIHSPYERFLRFALGLYAVVLGVLFIQGTAGTGLAVLGGLGALTGASGRCPLYLLRERGCAVSPAPDAAHEDSTSQENPPAA